MLELQRYPACVLHCHTLLDDPAQPSMSDRKYSGSTRDVSLKTDRRSKNATARDHRHARSSADDPTISSTRSSKHVSSNARTHPRAELRDSATPHKGGKTNQGSPLSANHVSNETNGGRKRPCEGEDEVEGSVWVEHTSSSGRVYYYNKKNGVSQWERPVSMSKRTKTDDPHSKTTASSASAASKHSSSHTHSTGSAHSHSHTSSSLHAHGGGSSSSAHSHSHTPSHPHHGSGGSWELGGHRSSTSTHHSSSSHHTTAHSSHASSSSSSHDRVRGGREQRDRGRSGTGHRRSNRGSRSSSKSNSVSPTTVAASGSRGRSHHEKTTPNRHSRSHGSGGSKRESLSPLPGGKPSQISSSTVAVSPCTPTIPHGASQVTSASSKHREKLLSSSGDPVTPSTSHSPTSSSSFATAKHTQHSHARQKRLFTGQQQQHQQQHANGPSSQYLTAGGPGTPVQNSVPHSSATTELSPQIGMETLHPLQRALLLQQQQQQQQAAAPDVLPGQSTPGTPLPSSGGGATPLSQSLQAVTPPISALPPHVTSQLSHPGSPYSPSHTPSFAMPTPTHLVSHTFIPGPYSPQGLPPGSQTTVYPYTMPMMVPANTPIAGIYMADGSVVPAAAVAAAGPGGGAYVTPGTPVVVALRPPMSRLASRRRSSSSDEFASFPDPARVEWVASGADPGLFSRSLAESWWTPATENMQKQLDVSHREVLSRRNTEALYLQGRLRRTQLSLDTTQLRTTTRRERLLALEHLISDIDKR